jgi:hypothetical protein
MTSPWDQEQRSDERSKDHGKRDKDHNEHEHGTGARRSPDDPRDFPLEKFLASAGVQPAAAIDFPATYLLPNRPPHRNQLDSPQCVAYSSGYDQSHLDRTELGRFFDPWESRFFGQINGGPNGAFMRDALQRRLEYGYPVQNTGHRGRHRIGAYYRVPLGLEQVRLGLVTKPVNGGILVLGPWYHSWFHPLASGKLPAPDYEVGGHAWWLTGWDDARGLRGQNSWGTGWGAGGDFYLPYSFLSRMWEVWRTVDR